MNNRSFHLDKSNGKLMGVCSGIANYFDWDVNLIRIAFVLAALFGVGARTYLSGHRPHRFGSLSGEQPMPRQTFVLNGVKSVAVSKTSTPSRRFSQPTTA